MGHPYRELTTEGADSEADLIALARCGRRRARAVRVASRAAAASATLLLVFVACLHDAFPKRPSTHRSTTTASESTLVSLGPPRIERRKTWSKRFAVIRWEPIRLRGQLNAATVDGIVRQSVSGFRLRYENGSYDDPVQRGRVTIKFVIDGDSHVVEAEAIDSNLRNLEVEPVAGSVGTMCFRPWYGTVTVIDSIILGPSPRLVVSGWGALAETPS
jgi:hypothetical protein